jgi:hypothetical protein
LLPLLPPPLLAAAAPPPLLPADFTIDGSATDSGMRGSSVWRRSASSYTCVYFSGALK